MAALPNLVRAKPRAVLAGSTRAGVTEERIQTIGDLRRIPIFSKEELRSTQPAALLPNPGAFPPHVGRWTSGTSGRPTVNFWTETDWAALVASTARMLKRHAPM